MATIIICFEFAGVGHGYISIIPSDIEMYKQVNPGCRTFNLSTGDYDLQIEGVVNIDGAKAYAKNHNGEIIGSVEIPTGQFDTGFQFSVI